MRLLEKIKRAFKVGASDVSEKTADMVDSGTGFVKSSVPSISQ